MWSHGSSFRSCLHSSILSIGQHICSERIWMSSNGVVTKWKDGNTYSCLVAINTYNRAIEHKMMKKKWWIWLYFANAIGKTLSAKPWRRRVRESEVARQPLRQSVCFLVCIISTRSCPSVQLRSEDGSSQHSSIFHGIKAFGATGPTIVRVTPGQKSCTVDCSRYSSTGSKY